MQQIDNDLDDRAKQLMDAWDLSFTQARFIAEIEVGMHTENGMQGDNDRADARWIWVDDPDVKGGRTTEDYLIEEAQAKTGQIFESLTDEMLDWLKQYQSLEEMQSALKNGSKLYDRLSVDALENELFELMMLADFAGREEVIDGERLDSMIRVDAKRPLWFRLPFKEAIAAFRKKVVVPTNSYKRMEEGYHWWVFSVSRMTKASMVEDAKWVVDQGLTEGLGYDDLTKMWNRLIGRQGWKPSGNENHRIYTILDTNIRSAYGAGRAEQMYDPAIVNRRPFAIWRWRDSPNPRQNHKALHNKAIALSDPFFEQVTVPAGFGCRCSIFSASRDYCDRNNIEILNNPPDPTTIADPGFRYPLRGFSEDQKRDVVESAIANLSPELQKKIRSEIDGR